ncbi:hypothetical protein RHS01_07176 [Rhizoctonia solani]|uniref:Uncharacterized protein n=1 Tax=Rhizoctonia solani TaxID=456999 RepID=A0A8H7IBC4_9AGAM|nr:hypothetical protein RHS01_07176 [Rhizoctonia solani]
MRIRTIQRNVPRLVSKPHILPALESAGIKTTHDVLFTPLGELLNRLSGAEDILTTDIIELQDEIAAVCAVPGIRGDELLENEVLAAEAMNHTRFPRSGSNGEREIGDHNHVRLVRVQIILSFEIDEFQNTLDSIEASLTVNDPTLLHIDYSFAVIIGKLSSFPAVHSRRPDYASPLWADHRFVKPRTRNNGQYHETTRKDRSRSQFDGDGTRALLPLSTEWDGLPFDGQVLNKTANSPTRNPLSSFPKTTAKPALGPTFTFLSHATIWLSTADTTLEKRGRQGETHIVEVFRSRVGVRTFLLCFRIGSNVRASRRTAGVCSLYRTGWLFYPTPVDNTPHDNSTMYLFMTVKVSQFKTTQ